MRQEEGNGTPENVNHLRGDQNVPVNLFTVLSEESAPAALVGFALSGCEADVRRLPIALGKALVCSRFFALGASGRMGVKWFWC